jgi:uncharacterized protein YbjT (DUF2867 family)
MTDRDTILVTGATGNTGSRIVTRLATLGHTVKAANRRATEQDGAQAVPFDWHDPATHPGALKGSDRLYLVPPIGASDPAAVMLPFLAQARATGVRRVVLLSSSAIPAGGPRVGRVHKALIGMFDEWAVLRPSWFMQNFTGDHPHADSIRRGHDIVTATGEGRVGFIDAADVAAVAVHALTHETAPNTDLVITGPEALSYGDIAATITRINGRPVHHRSVTPAELTQRLIGHGVPADFAPLLASLDDGIRAGAEDRVTDTVERITGRPARSFSEFAETEIR